MAVKKSQEGGVSRPNKLWINYNDSTQLVISFIGQYLVHQVNVFMRKKNHFWWDKKIEENIFNRDAGGVIAIEAWLWQASSQCLRDIDSSPHCVLLFYYSVQLVTSNFLFVVAISWLLLLSIAGLILTTSITVKHAYLTIRAERVGKQGLILQRTEGIKHILLSKSSKILPLRYIIYMWTES